MSEERMPQEPTASVGLGRRLMSEEQIVPWCGRALFLYIHQVDFGHLRPLSIFKH